MRVYIIFAFLLLLAGCATSNTIHIEDVAPWYFPAVLEIEPGTTVTFDGSMAAVVHPVSTLTAPEPIHSGHYSETWSYTFTEPGIYHYICPVHPYMQGFIAVGEQLDEQDIPTSLLEWPPKSMQQEPPSGTPAVSGTGEVWLNAQFQQVPGKDKPGTIIVVDTHSWTVKNVIDDDRLNNPHNLWMSPNKKHIVQTNWFDSYVSIIDRYSGLIIKHVYVGESPAHVIADESDLYVTVQGIDGIAILDGDTYTVRETVKTVQAEHGHGMHASPGTGPHGHWLSADGELMSVANTEGASIAVWNTTSQEIIFSHGTDPLPLMAGISADGTRAWISSYLSGQFLGIDLEEQTVIANFTIGKGPVQAIPSPDGKYITVALASDAEAVILDAQTFEILKRLPSGQGAHGVTYGPKESGGWYAYVSNKFVPWITVIDMDSLDVAGYVPLGEESLGGQGILAVFDQQ